MEEEIICCIECLSEKTYITKVGSEAWYRVFENGIMIGWYCAECYREQNKREKSLDKKIRFGIKLLFPRVLKYNTSRYVTCESILEKRRMVKYECMNFYSNGSMNCVNCQSIEDLCLDHINDDGMEERERINKRGGWHFYEWLYDNNFPPGYRVLCRRCNSLDYDSKKHLIIPRRYINKYRKNPEILKIYKKELLLMLKDI